MVPPCFVFTAILAFLPALSALPAADDAKAMAAFFRGVAGGRATQTEADGGSGGKEFKATTPGGILIGLDVWQGKWGADTMVIAAICPIFQTEAGIFRGPVYGRPEGKPTTVQAKPGFAVGAMRIRTGTLVDAMQIVFWRVVWTQNRLTADGAYKAPLIGGEGGTKRYRPLGGTGKPTVGIFGASGLQIDRLGLLVLEK